jgi:shikimate kinase / 3-dehydroquinate synthase
VPGNVYLCGPPGAGKSSVAPLLAGLRASEAVDVDALIEADDGRPIARIVEEDGEAAFRELERATIAALAQRENLVVALGAGALEFEENRRAVEASGVTVFLDASLETCERRTASQNGTRPLLRDEGALARLHAARRPRYLDAAIRVSADVEHPDGVARAIAAQLNGRRDGDSHGYDSRDGNSHDVDSLAASGERVVRVNTAKPYDVVIGPRAVRHLAEPVRPHDGGRVALVADERLGTIVDLVEAAYASAGLAVTVIRVHADEALKSLAGLEMLYGTLVEARVDRRGIIVGVGGGTIGDAVGFAAATFQRGVPYVAVPTTLLAAVDAAIGGKTAINLPSGKNLVGTVTQPAHVAIAPEALDGLDDRDRLSGYGEMLKYGLALDAQLYRTMRANERAILADPRNALDEIARCVELKADVVARDEEDRTGIRAVLNFGHTVGHAIERVAGYGRLRHGEAVIVGMRAALALSAACGTLDERARSDADAHLAALPVPNSWRDLDAAAIVEATHSDKKRHASGTQYVLLDAIGSSRLHDGVRDDDVRNALRGIGVS